jgi:hypothetical protein
MTARRPPVAIVDYGTRWPEKYEEERKRILGAIGAWPVDIRHIGGTAVPGLAAKMAARSGTITLMCMCKEAAERHRSLLGDLIGGLDEEATA